MVFHLCLSDSKSPQVSRTFNIVADLNNAVVWIVSIRPLIFKSSIPFTNPLVTVPRASITIGITVTFMFHSLFQFPRNVLVLIFLYAFFQFYNEISWNSEVHNSACSLFCWLSLGLVVWSISNDLFVSQNPKDVWTSRSPWQILVCAYTIYSYGQIKITSSIPSGSPCPTRHF